MNDSAKKIFKLIGKGVAVLVTPGSLAILFVLLVIFLFHWFKKRKAKQAIGPDVKTAETTITDNPGINKTV